MSEMMKDFWLGMPIGMYIILVIAVILLIASWIAPPLGAITPSALQGTALILGAAWLFYVTANIPNFIESGAKIKASYGDAQIEIGKNKNEIVRSENEYTEEKEEDNV